MDFAAGSPQARESSVTLSLLDVTIRDGGYVNGHAWTLDEAVSIARAIDAAGIPFAEVGYLRTPRGDLLRPSAYCERDYLRTLSKHLSETSMAVMVRPGEVGPVEVASVIDHGVAMVRVLVPRLDVAQACPYIEAARAAGLTVAVNLIRVSEAEPATLGEAAAECARAGAQIVYLADSNGSLFPEDVRPRIAAAMESSGLPIGFHPHDNLGLAFPNTRAALEAGATFVDASIGGIGKGAGNLRLELIAAHWVYNGLADVRLDPLIRDRSTYPARQRMLADGSSGHSLLTGLLDVNLDSARSFQESVAAKGFDSVLRAGRAG